jgi:hypothetical protein
MILRVRWKASLTLLVAVRVAGPLLALVAAGRDLPGLPPYDYQPLNGDANGFYAEARELIAAVAGPAGLVALLIAAAGVVAARRLWPRWLSVAAATLALSLAATAIVLASEPAGAAVVGWPLLWAVVLFPLRLAGLLDPDTAFALGLPLQLAANAVAVVATAYAGWYASGRRSIGLGAAALLATWPILARLLAGESAWENGQWNADVGLHLYTEPASTALVAVGLALLLSPGASDLRLALAGTALGFATVVKLSNGVLAALAVAIVAWRLGRRRALPLLAAGIAFAPLVVAYWSKGYPEIPNKPGWSASFVETSWTESLVFSPRTLLVIAPLAALGAWALRRRPYELALLVAAVASNAVLYSFYEHTRLHPRFLSASLPALFVLEAAGALLLIRKLSRRQGEARL